MNDFNKILEFVKNENAYLLHQDAFLDLLERRLIQKDSPQRKSMQLSSSSTSQPTVSISPLADPQKLEKYIFLLYKCGIIGEIDEDFGFDAGIVESKIKELYFFAPMAGVIEEITTSLEAKIKGVVDDRSGVVKERSHLVSKKSKIESMNLQTDFAGAHGRKFFADALRQVLKLEKLSHVKAAKKADTSTTVIENVLKCTASTDKAAEVLSKLGHPVLAHIPTLNKES